MKLFNLVEETNTQPTFTTKILASFIISHGFLDFYKFKNILLDTGFYLGISFIYFLLLKLLPSFGLFYFMLSSVSHFNDDIVFLVEKFKLGKGYKKIFYKGFGSSVFLGTLLSRYNYEFYYIVLNELIRNNILTNIVYSTFMIITLVQYICCSYYYHRKERILVISLVSLGYILGPFYFPLYYLSFIHLPIAIYKLNNNLTLFQQEKMSYFFITLGIIIFHNIDKFIPSDKFNPSDKLNSNGIIFDYYLRDIAFAVISVLMAHMYFAKLVF